MCNASNEKWQQVIWLTECQDNIRTLGEKETYKYLSILEADIIKQVEMKGKIKKNISEELESYSRQNCQAENLSKEQIPGLYSSLDIRDPLWSGPEKNLSKWTKQQGN